MAVVWWLIGAFMNYQGNILTLIMVFMYTTAVDSIRRRYFNVFYFTHHLFVPFFILLLFHGTHPMRR